MSPEVLVWENFMRSAPSKRDLWFVIRKAESSFKDRAWREMLRRKDLTVEDLLRPFHEDSSSDWKDVEVWRSRAWTELVQHPNLTERILDDIASSPRLGAEWEWRARLRMLNLPDTSTANLWHLRMKLIAASKEAPYRNQELAQVLSEAPADVPNDDPLSSLSEAVDSRQRSGRQEDVMRNVAPVLLQDANLNLLARTDLTPEMLRQLIPGLAPE